MSMIGITHQVSFAPPVRNQSTEFIATSIDIIEIKLIPIAVFKADKKLMLWRMRIQVSSIMLVNKPLKIASSMMFNVGHGIAAY